MAVGLSIPKKWGNYKTTREASTDNPDAIGLILIVNQPQQLPTASSYLQLAAMSSAFEYRYDKKGI